MFIDFRETGRERERRTSMWERNINWLPPVYTPTGDWTHNQACALTRDQSHSALVYGMMLQPTESPGQGWTVLLTMVKMVSFMLGTFCHNKTWKKLYDSADKFRDWTASISCIWHTWLESGTTSPILLQKEQSHPWSCPRALSPGSHFHLHHFLETTGGRGDFFTKNPDWRGTEEALTDIQRDQILVWVKHGTKVQPQRKRRWLILGPTGKQQRRGFTRQCWREHSHCTLSWRYWGQIVAAQPRLTAVRGEGVGGWMGRVKG